MISYIQVQAPENWRSFSGLINFQMIKKAFPQTNESTLGLYCGPKGFNKLIN
jgi:hypothetical protein